MATVVYTDRTDKFFVNWQFEGENYNKVFKGRTGSLISDRYASLIGEQLYSKV